MGHRNSQPWGLTLAPQGTLEKDLEAGAAVEGRVGAEPSSEAHSPPSLGDSNASPDLGSNLTSAGETRVWQGPSLHVGLATCKGGL